MPTLAKATEIRRKQHPELVALITDVAGATELLKLAANKAEQSLRATCSVVHVRQSTALIGETSARRTPHVMKVSSQLGVSPPLDRLGARR